MQQCPTVCIGISVYNQSYPQIQDCIQSALAQEKIDFEIIIRIDGIQFLQPGVTELLQSLCKADRRIRILEDVTHQGTFASYRDIFRNTEAEFICQLDADDALHPCALFTCVDELSRRKKAPYAYTDCMEVDHLGNYIGLGARQQTRIVDNSDLVQFIPFHLRVIRLYEYRAAGEYNGEYRYCGDFDLALRLEERGPGLYVKKPLYFYRMHSNNASRISEQSLFYESTRAIREAFVRRKLQDRFHLVIDGNSKTIELRQKPKSYARKKIVPQSGAQYPTLCITGMHRSGTSLLAQLVEQAGYNIGMTLQEPDEHNPRGYLEDSEVVHINRTIFHRESFAASRGWADWGWSVTNISTGSFEPDLLMSARELAERRLSTGLPWAFKDPRCALTLNFWKEAIRDLRFLFVYRHPMEVELSIERLNAPVFADNPDLGRLIWSDYNRRILDFYASNKEICCIVGHHDLVSDAQQTIVHAFETLGLTSFSDAWFPSTLDPYLIRSHGRSKQRTSSIYFDCYNETKEILCQLCRTASRRASFEIGSNSIGTILSDYRQRTESDIGIVIVSFNRGPSLLNAVMSVIENSVRFHHIVVVDNGSTDQETHRILEFLNKNEINVIRKTRGPLAEARNIGIQAIQTKLILPLDDDNRLLPGYLVLAEHFLAGSKVDIAFGDKALFGCSSGYVQVPEFNLADLHRENYIDACAVFPKAAWQNCGGYDENVDWVCDWDLWISMSSRGYAFGRIPCACFEYRVSTSSYITSWNSNFDNQIWTMRYLSSKHCRLIGSLVV